MTFSPMDKVDEFHLTYKAIVIKIYYSCLGAILCIILLGISVCKNCWNIDMMKIHCLCSYTLIALTYIVAYSITGQP